MKVLVTQSCPTLCDLLDSSPPGSSVHAVLKARTLEWVASPSSRASSWPRDQTLVCHIAGRFFTVWATREAPIPHVKKEILPVIKDKFRKHFVGEIYISCRWIWRRMKVEKKREKSRMTIIQLMNLHWNVIVTPSPEFTLGFTLCAVHMTNRMNSNVNSGFGVTGIFQCRLINC